MPLVVFGWKVCVDFVVAATQDKGYVIFHRLFGLTESSIIFHIMTVG
jgi:hypothetical protein